MSKPRKDLRKHNKNIKAARTVRQRLIWSISILSAILIAFIFKIGESLWLAWMVEYRLRIVGLLTLVLVCLIVLSPLIIEYSKTPRALSGPGKNPYIDP